MPYVQVESSRLLDLDAALLRAKITRFPEPNQRGIPIVQRDLTFLGGIKPNSEQKIHRDGPRSSTFKIVRLPVLVGNGGMDPYSSPYVVP